MLPHPALPRIIHPAVRPASRPMASAQVLFFGKIADRFGRRREVWIPTAGCSVAQLKARLASEVEGGAEALAEPGLRVAVDQDLCAEDLWIRPGQEVAFCSMFSGG